MLDGQVPDLNELRDPVYVVSKGRADNCMTAMRLEEAGADFCIIVEPQDRDAYAEAHGAERLVVLDRNDGGLSYARNAALDHFAEHHPDALGSWQLDDDVKSCWHHQPGNKRTRISIVNMLAYCERVMEPYSNIGFAGPMKSPFAFAYCDQPPLRVNRSYASIHWNRNPCLIRYRDSIVEDYDAAMQWLSQGWCGLLAAHVSFDSPMAGVQKGGMTEETYTADASGRDKHTDNCERLIAEWPGAFQFRVDPHSGKMRLAPSNVWGKFPQRPTEM